MQRFGHVKTCDADLLTLLREAKRLAKKYYSLTGRPLGITGEIAECEAVQLLGLEIADVRQAGYDAVRRKGQGVERLQIKGRCVLPSSKASQRVGRIQLDKEWDAVLLVLLDLDFNTTAIYEAQRSDVTEALCTPGSKARNDRGALSVSKFKSIGKRIWPAEDSLAADV